MTFYEFLTKMLEYKYLMKADNIPPDVIDQELLDYYESNKHLIVN
jgi:hypothetical protein